MAFHVPNQFRVITGRMASTPENGNNGWFVIPSKFKERQILFCIASDGLGWDHVSIHAERGNQLHIPLWDEMCQLKDLFWDDEDTVMQYHPKKSDYINISKHTLHLWRPQEITIPTPPLIMV